MSQPGGGVEWNLDRASSVPVYAQIEQRLGQMIESGAVPLGGRVPSERELAERAGVSRQTARAALDSLARRGLLERGVGRRGTVVRSTRLTLDLADFAGFTEMLGRHGVKATARVLELARLEAPEQIARELELPPREEVYRVRRVRLADGEPITLEDSWLPAARFPSMLDLDVRGSLYRLMGDVYGIVPARASQRLEPVVAEREQATALAVAPGSPLMLVRRIARCSEGIPVEFALDHYRGDRALFVIKVSTSGVGALATA
jgi:GntR family transcriptional regulator